MRLFHTTTPERAAAILDLGFDAERDALWLGPDFASCIHASTMPLDERIVPAVCSAVLVLEAPDADLAPCEIRLVAPADEAPRGDPRAEGVPTGEYAIPVGLANRALVDRTIHDRDTVLATDPDVLARRAQRNALDVARSIVRGADGGRPREDR